MESGLEMPVAQKTPLLHDLSIKKEVAPTSENLLEGAILVHGFCGNVDTNNPYAEETKALGSILSSGELVSPSARPLDDKEKVRFSAEAPFDQNRVTFHVWKGDDQDGTAYIRSAFFASPTSILGGFVPSEDPAWAGRAISAYSKDGVHLPIERGLLFLDSRLATRFQPQFEALAQKAGMSYTDYMNQHAVILPQEAFNDQSTLWSAVSNRIEPAVGVTIQVVTGKEQMDSTRGTHFTDILDHHQSAQTSELGLTGVKQGSAISPELLTHMEKVWHENIEWLDEVERNMDNDPLKIEHVRGERQEIVDMQTFIDELHLNNQDAQTLADQYNKRKRQVLELNEKVLESKYPNAPLEEVEGIHRPVFEPTVTRGKDGKLHVEEPL